MPPTLPSATARFELRRTLEHRDQDEWGRASGRLMPLYAILVREYFGARMMGAVLGAFGSMATLGMALGPWAGGWLYDTSGNYFWLCIGSFGIGLGAVAIAWTLRPPRPLPIRCRVRASPASGRAAPDA